MIPDSLYPLHAREPAVYSNPSAGLVSILMPECWTIVALRARALAMDARMSKAAR